MCQLVLLSETNPSQPSRLHPTPEGVRVSPPNGGPHVMGMGKDTSSP